MYWMTFFFWHAEFELDGEKALVFTMASGQAMKSNGLILPTKVVV